MRWRRPYPSGWPRQCAPVRPVEAACRRAARRRTPPGRRAREAGCASARSRSRRTGCRRAHGRRPSHRNGWEEHRRSPATRAAAARLACKSRAWPRASPATCRSGRPTSPISSESPLKTSHGSSVPRRGRPPGGVVGGCVARSGDRRHDRVPELDGVAVVQRNMRERHGCTGRQVAGRTRPLDQRRQPRTWSA